MAIKFALDVFLHLREKKYPVGKCLQADHEIFFEYEPDFIKTNLELSPFKLPLKPGAYSDDTRVFEGLPGLLYDSLPDGWGLLLMDRYFRQQGFELNTISPLQRLAYIGDRALGALSYHPCTDIDYQWKRKMKLETLARDCEIVLHGKENHVLPELIIAGGSPGGARPKVIVGFHQGRNELCSGVSDLPEDFQHYLIKFSAMIDVNDNAQVEYAYSLMARDCHITMPETRLFDAGKFGPAFGIARFDRINNKRIHMHTLSGLLHANFRIPNLDYIDFLKATWLLTQDKQDVLQGFRRMVFNVLTHNRDDHSKNFAFLFHNNQWRLSPAYDLTFSSGIAGEHTMTIAGEGANPTINHFLEVARILNINKTQAHHVINETKMIVSNWPKYAKRANVEKPIISRLKKIFENITI